jgi:orotate phosphoribosyltransferase
MVGFSGRDKYDRQFVGDIYSNFAAIERKADYLAFVARQLKEIVLPFIDDKTIICALPMGGDKLGTALQLALGIDAIFLDKKVTALATENSRQKTQLIFGRHEIEEDTKVIYVDDAYNNWKGIKDAINATLAAGGIPTLAAGFLNRSMTVRNVYKNEELSVEIPIRTLLNEPVEEYQQDNPEVVEDVERNNVAWEPKLKWTELMAAMHAIESCS